MRKNLGAWKSSLVLVLIPLGSVGCGLVSSDIADFTFRLPQKSYSFNADALNLPSALFPLPEVACGTDADCVCPAVDTGTCSSVTLACRGGACAAVRQVQVPATVDLATEAPEFQNVGSQSLVRFELKSFDYHVVSSLNVELPSVDIYLAPQGTTSISSPGVQKLGTIPPTPAGATVSEKIIPVAGANDVFSQFAKDWKTPFNFIAVSDLTVRAGQAQPTGKADITVSGYVVAKPAL